MTVDTDISARLIGVLRSATGTPGLEYERRPEALRGGFWADLWSFSLANPPDGWPAGLVARLMPDPGLALKETIVQRAVAAAGFPTPQVRAAGGPDGGLGRAFLVMDRAAGRPLLADLDGALTPAAVPRLLHEIPDLLATSMARLHALDPGLVRGELERVRAVPVTTDGLLRALTQLAAESGRQDWPAPPGGWPGIRPRRPPTSSATATCTRSTCSPMLTTGKVVWAELSEGTASTSGAPLGDVRVHRETLCRG